MSRRLPSPTGACPEIYPEPSPEIRRGEHRSPAYNIEVYAGGRGRPPLHARPNLTKIPEAGIAHPLFLRFGYHREGQSPSPTPVFRRNRLVKQRANTVHPYTAPRIDRFQIHQSVFSLAIPANAGPIRPLYILLPGNIRAIKRPIPGNPREIIGKSFAKQKKDRRSARPPRFFTTPPQRSRLGCPCVRRQKFSVS